MEDAPRRLQIPLPEDARVNTENNRKRSRERGKTIAGIEEVITVMRGKRMKDAPDLLTVEELAQFLRLSLRATYSLLASGVIRSSRVGIGRGRYRIRQEDAQSYIEARLIKRPDVPCLAK